MSVLLFMPESGGNPLESIILTSASEKNDGGSRRSSHDENGYHEVTRFEFENGKPVRKHSVESALSSLDNDEGERSIDMDLQENGIEIDDLSHDISLISDHSFQRKLPTRSRSTDTAGIASTRSGRRQGRTNYTMGGSRDGGMSTKKRSLRRSKSSASDTTLASNTSRTHSLIATARHPQTRLSPIGAIFGATSPSVAKVMNQATERKYLHSNDGNHVRNKDSALASSLATASATQTPSKYESSDNQITTEGGTTTHFSKTNLRKSKTVPSSKSCQVHHGFLV